MTLESYVDSEGLAHWTDCELGDEKEKFIDWSDWLTGQGDSLTTITWTVPSGLTNMSTWEADGIAYIKLSCDSAGTHEIVCALDSTDGAKTQKKHKTIYLKVV